MKIKNKPKEPVRWKNKQHKKEIFDGESLKFLVDFLANIGIDIENAKIGEASGYWDGYYMTYLYWKSDEPEEEFAARMKTYETKLCSYNEWLEANNAEIEKELEERHNKKVAKQQKEIAALENKLIELKKGKQC